MTGEYQGPPLGSDAQRTHVLEKDLAQAKITRPRAAQEQLLELRQAQSVSFIQGLILTSFTSWVFDWDENKFNPCYYH